MTRARHAFDAPPSEKRRFTESPASRSLPPSLPPRLRSIFTLRPASWTEQPPDEASATPPGNPRKLAWISIGVTLACSGFALAVWALKAPKHTDRGAIVLVNGAPKLKQTPSGAVERWASDVATTIAIDTSVDQLGPGAREAVITSFGTWIGAGAALPKVSFDSNVAVQAKLERDGVSAVVYAPIEIDGHKNDVAITIGFADNATGRIVEADIILNSAKQFAVLDGGEKGDCGGKYDIQSVATHEAGHFFGLGEDLDDPAATMFIKTGKCDVKKRNLKDSDTTTMAELYARAPNDDEVEASKGCAIARASETHGSSAWIVAVALLGAPPLLRRRRSRVRAKPTVSTGLSAGLALGRGSGA